MNGRKLFWSYWQYFGHKKSYFNQKIFFCRRLWFENIFISFFITISWKILLLWLVPNGSFTYPVYMFCILQSIFKSLSWLTNLWSNQDKLFRSHHNAVNEMWRIYFMGFIFLPMLVRDIKRFGTPALTKECRVPKFIPQVPPILQRQRIWLNFKTFSKTISK